MATVISATCLALGEKKERKNIVAGEAKKSAKFCLGSPPFAIGSERTSRSLCVEDVGDKCSVLPVGVRLDSCAQFVKRAR